MLGVRDPRGNEWSDLLRRLARQLDIGTLYYRDMPELTAALNDVLAAFERHRAVRERQRIGHR